MYWGLSKVLISLHGPEPKDLPPPPPPSKLLPPGINRNERIFGLVFVRSPGRCVLRRSPRAPRVRPPLKLLEPKFPILEKAIQRMDRRNHGLHPNIARWLIEVKWGHGNAEDCRTLRAC